jgi:hypothetical protein
MVCAEPLLAPLHVCFSPHTQKEGHSTSTRFSTWINGRKVLRFVYLHDDQPTKFCDSLSSIGQSSKQKAIDLFPIDPIPPQKSPKRQTIPPISPALASLADPQKGFAPNSPQK